MALRLTSHPTFCFKRPKKVNSRLVLLRCPSPSLPFSDLSTKPKFLSLCVYSSYSRNDDEPYSFSTRIPINKPPQEEVSDEKPAAISFEEAVDEGGSDGSPIAITDEWGEKTESEPATSNTKFSDADPPMDYEGEREEEGTKEYVSEKGSPSSAPLYDKLGDLKRALVDTFYGTEFGFRASTEVRAEVLELVNQLEASNPTLAPVESSSLLSGNWVLLYTAFSELLPLLAAGATPLLKVKSVYQKIDTQNLTIDNFVTLSSPFATFSFSLGATFEVRSPSRIQFQFNEGIFQPPEIKSSVDLPGDVEVLGQKINLAPLQKSLSPLQEVVASISHAISSQPHLKVPIPEDMSKSWLLITYLDGDLQISRGDGGLFVLVKEGSPLLDQKNTGLL